MSPQQALNLIEQATGLLQLNRADHENIKLALNILRAEIFKPDPKPQPDKESVVD